MKIGILAAILKRRKQFSFLLSCFVVVLEYYISDTTFTEKSIRESSFRGPLCTNGSQVDVMHLKVYYVIFSRGALNPRKKMEADIFADLHF